jgi:hypothetical protein
MAPMAVVRPSPGTSQVNGSLGTLGIPYDICRDETNNEYAASLGSRPAKVFTRALHLPHAFYLMALTSPSPHTSALSGIESGFARRAIGRGGSAVAGQAWAVEGVDGVQEVGGVQAAKAVKAAGAAGGRAGQTARTQRLKRAVMAMAAVAAEAATEAATETVAVAPSAVAAVVAESAAVTGPKCARAL